MDTVTKEKRSEIMSKIRSVSMMERLARSLAVETAGCRLTHQPQGIFGRPDYANKGRRVAVFVLGCFFHYPCPRKCTDIPKSNTEFWEKKFKRNAERHKEVVGKLTADGWLVHEIWEHQVRERKRRTGK